MTDRIKGVVVALEKDVREDDAKCIIDAILMIKGVSNLTTSIADSDDYINRDMVKREVIEKIYGVVRSI